MEMFALYNQTKFDNINLNEARQKAQELEGVFLNTLMKQMFSSIKTDGLFGGGQAEETWRSMQSEQYANLLAKNGGIGLADSILADLIAIQENTKAQSPTKSEQSILMGIYQNER